MDPTLSREHLEKLIAEEHAALAQLETLLVAEQSVLQKDELTAVEAASDARQRSMGELLRIQDERRALLRLHGFNDDKFGIEKILAWCDPESTLRRSWRECADVATRCRTLNERNSALVAARMQRVENLLQVIVGPSRHAGVYSATGRRDQAHSGGLLAAEA